MITHISKTFAQQIVDTVKDVCGRNINFIHPSGIIFASTSPERIGEFHEIGRKVAETGETIEVTDNASFEGTQNGVNLPIFHLGNLIAIIGITGPPEEVRSFAYLAVRITKLLIREQELEASSRSHQEKIRYVVRSLVQEETGNPLYLRDCMEELGIPSQSRFLVCLIRLNHRCNPSNLSMIEWNLDQFFQALDIPLKCYEYPRDYIILLPEKNVSLCRSRLELYANEHRELISIGIGTAKAPSQLCHSYREALVALNSLEFSQKAYGDFANLDVEMLLGNLTAECREDYLAKTVSLLTPHECELLRVYYEENMSLSETGKRLFLHKNTLQYQLNKIHQKTGYNPRSFRDAVVLYLGLRIGS